MRRILSLVLILLLLGAMFVMPAGAADGTVCFLAVNDTIPGTLDDATMPFYSRNQLYIPYSIFYTSALGVTPVYQATTQTLTLSSGNATLVFRLDEGTATNGTSVTTASPALLQGGLPFVPLNYCAQAFGISISYLTSRSGYAVVRLTTGAEIYSDALFIEKAETLLETRVAQYLASDEPEMPQENTSTPAVPSTPATPSTPGSQATQGSQTTQQESPANETTPEDSPPVEPVTLLPAIVGAAEMDDAHTLLLSYGIDGIYFFTEAEIQAYPDLIMQLYAAGVRIGVTVSSDTEDIAAGLNAANDRLYQLLHTRTLLALLPASAEPPAGYLTLTGDAFPTTLDRQALAEQSIVFVCTSSSLENLLQELTQADIPFEISQVIEAHFSGN